MFNNMVRVNFENKEEMLVPVGTQAIDVVARCFNKKDNVIAVRVNNKVHSLNYKIVSDCIISVITYYDTEGHKIYARSLKLLFMMAVRNTYSDLKYTIGNKIGDHFYIEANLTENMVKKIYDEMVSLTLQKLNITKIRVPYQILEKIYNEINEQEALENLKKSVDPLFSVYKADEKYFPWLYGRVVINTSFIKYFDLELLKDGTNISGAILKMPSASDIKKIDEKVQISTIHYQFQKFSKVPRQLGINSVADLNNMALDEKKIEKLILMSEDEQSKRIYKISDEILKSKKRLVFIAGPSSSGKTTFSQRLQISLGVEGIKSTVLSLDNYFRDASVSKDFESISHVDVPFFKNQMEALLRHERVDIPYYNFKTGGTREFHSNFVKLEEDDILIVEGIHSLNPILSSFLPKDKVYKIYIAPFVTINIDRFTKPSTNDVRLLRRIVRDYQDRKVDLELTLKRWEGVKKGEKENIHPYVKEANAIFNSFLPYEVGVLKVFADPLLLSSLNASSPGEFYSKIKELKTFLDSFIGIFTDSVPTNSILREFIGKGCFVR